MMNTGNTTSFPQKKQLCSDHQARMIPISQLVPAENYPFSEQNLEVCELTKSIQEHNLQEPLLVYEKSPGLYSIISGHLRYQSCIRLGCKEIPCRICQCSDEDDATLKMLDSILYQRREIKISSMALIADLMLEAYKHQGRKLHDEDESRSNKRVADKLHITVNMVKDYVSITRLQKDLLTFVDNKRISVSAAAILSGLPDQYQKKIHDVLYKDKKSVMTCHIASELLKLYQESTLTMKVLVAMMKKQTPEKKEKITLNFECERLSLYVDVSGTPEEVMQRVLDLLERYAYPLTMGEKKTLSKHIDEKPEEKQIKAAAG